ncbi:RagB/SusD family nutrient uptake outer membrane protein [Mariniflexile gromovii]|uniref:RagB/SusD family nutrient uptake outer membrane protein n=1 Tax=Mariniflexile gromovii TaxID=362523 RepID=A0ABS4BTH1_9FLAO|nr:RagB/SusD family nutrient uptake outer membrane protein [Mariniflexile gromovii]MBP0903878.1 RagB/SusD family nutrient uptake outer membrane protein [Mariniflexile gromovii]
MKKILILFSAVIPLLMGCESTFLDLDPLDATTESAFFNSPDDFEAAANSFYRGLQSHSPKNAYGGGSWNSGFADITDFGTDFTAWVQPEGQGATTVGNTDIYWHNWYGYLREVNILLKKAEEYNGNPSDISRHVAEAYFFRAWHHFSLLRRFGGVPLATKLFDVGEEALYGPRNSRYEVVEQILADLDLAMATGLPDVIPDTEIGKIGKYAAQAFKAEVLLYEATWEKYVGTDTDGDGITVGAGSAKPSGYPTVDAMLDSAVQTAKSVMDNGGYEIWNHNDVLDNLSYRHLFILDDVSNNAGLGKSTNKEYIIQSVFDGVLQTPGGNFSHTTGGRNAPTRHILDLFLSLDGLPIDKSPLFQGYYLMTDQFIDRDYRMISYFGENLPVGGGSLPMTGISSTSLSPITNRKFRAYSYQDGRETYNYPQLRYAEVLLTYAEALYERDGAISDADLNLSINILRDRAGVAHLTNAFVTTNNLDMLEEIRRERSVELYMENNRYNDLKRWGIAEEVLGQDLIGEVIEGTEYETNPALYNPAAYIYGTKKVQTGKGLLDAVIIDPENVRNFSQKNYLFPIPSAQITLNPALKQNPDY